MPPAFCANCQQMIARLLDYFTRERHNNGPLLPLAAVRERVANALQIGINSVSRISSKLASGKPIAGPAKRHRRKTVTDISEFQAAEIRNVIFEMHAKGEPITRILLRARLREKYLFEGSVSSLGRVLHRIGFRFNKNGGRLILMELPRLALLRTNFLQAYMRNLKSDKPLPVVFLDETWIFENGNTTTFSWDDKSAKSAGRINVGGKRHIVLQAGSRQGFIMEAALLFASKFNSGDHHGEINEENFLKWFEDQLLSQLKEPSLIVMDNASYHSSVVNKDPTSSWSKKDIQQWLRDQEIPFEETLLKVQLLDLVTKHKPTKIYKADQLALQYGHKVLRLPPYHSIFNPMELIWGIIKNYYNRYMCRDVTGSEKSLEMWLEALSTITAETWDNTVDQTEQIIEKWWSRELLFDQVGMGPLIINVGQECDSDSDMCSDIEDSGDEC